MIILDTDIVSELMRPRPSGGLLTRLAAVPVDEQATTAITIGELAYGAHRAQRPELFRRATDLLAAARVLSFDRMAAERYGEIRRDLERSGIRLADPDLRIAATALVHDATVITGNVRHLGRVPGINVEDWLRG